MTNPRNLNGRLKKALALVAAERQTAIACKFVLHASEILPDKTKRNVADFVDTLREFLDGKSDIHGTHQKAQQHISTEWTTTECSPENTSSTLSPVGMVMQTLLLACCKSELKTAKLLVSPTRYSPDAFDVAIEIVRGFGFTNTLAESERIWQLEHVESELRSGRDTANVTQGLDSSNSPID